MKQPMFRGYAPRPSFVTPGRYFLINPKFELSDTLVLSFDWEIKCVDKLPPVELEIVKITYGKGLAIKNYSDAFIFPGKIELAGVEAIPKKQNAIMQTNCQIKLLNKQIPFGQYHMLIKMNCLGKDHLIPQTLYLIKKK